MIVMNKRKGFIEIIAIPVLVICLIMLILDSGSHIGKQHMKREAVKVGHAKYTANENGDVKFEWLATQTAELNK